MLTLTTHGAAGTVTGSRHLLTRGNQRILVDCGMFQGLKNLRDLNWAPFPVEPRSIGAVVLTHAHLDHSGYLPKLVADGFGGPIYATPATRAVAELILCIILHLLGHVAALAVVNALADCNQNAVLLFQFFLHIF